MNPFPTDTPPPALQADPAESGVIATVDEVAYVPAMDAPPDKPHPFAYSVSIRNHSSRPVRVVGRKWVVREAGGRVTVVEGDGVVGQMPVIEPGATFSYQSYHVVAADAVVEGAYLAMDDAAAPLIVRIPKFRLHIPA